MTNGMTNKSRSAARAAVIVVAFLATAATSKRSPYYPHRDNVHTTDVYVHNATGMTQTMWIAMMAPDAYPDCDTTMAGDAAWVQPGQFDPLEWIARPAENVPLRGPWVEHPQRPCYVAMVATGDKRWAIRWWHERPGAHAVPFYAPRGEGLTAGALRLHGAGPTLVLVAPPDVVVTPMKVPAQTSIATDEPVEPRVPEWNNGISMLNVSDLDGPIGDSEWTISAAARIRGMLFRRFGYAYGTDLELGSTNTGGFLYDFTMYGFGAAVEGGGARAGVVIGGGLSGITGDRAGLAWQIPVEAFLNITAGDKIALSSWGRAQWVFREDPRQDGSDNAPFGDELRAGLSLEILLASDRQTPTLRRGLSISITYGELMGVSSFGVGIGGALFQRLR